MPTLYTATRVLTGDGRTLPHAGVLVDGERITAVGPAAELDVDRPRRHHVDGALLPGLVDAATLVELADAVDAPDHPGAAEALVRPTVSDAAAGWSDERRQRSARRGAQRLLRGGVTACVDHVRGGAGVPALSRTRLAGDSLVDVGAVGDHEADDVAAAVRTALGRRAPGRRIGLAVAAPPGDTSVAAVATLAAAAGDAPVRVVTRPGDPVDPEALAHAGVLRPGVTVGPNPAVGPAAAARLARAGATVLVLPAAAAPPELGVLADAGLEVVLGTGLAPTPDPLATAAAFTRLLDGAGLVAWPPAGGPAADGALALVTGLGARTLGWGATTGVLAPGRRADLVAVEHPGVADGGAAAVLAAAGRQVLTVVGGVQRARRAGAEAAWPPIDRQEWRGG